MVGRLLQCFEQRVCRADGHAIGIIDQADFSFSDQRAIHDLLLDLPDLLDLDLRRGQFAVRLDDEKIRMSAGLDLFAGPAGAAGVDRLAGKIALAVQRLCEAHRGRSLADRVFAVKEVGVSEALPRDGRLQ